MTEIEIKKEYKGRPKSENPKNDFIRYRVTKADLIKIEEKAKIAGMKVGEFCRESALKKKVVAKQKTTKITGEMLVELKRQGQNLNAITLHYHRNRDHIENAFNSSY